MPREVCLTRNRYRIPRVTEAALLLGGAACSDASGPPGGSTEGINVSKSRIDALAKAYCEHYAECYDVDDFDTSACADHYADEFGEEPNEACLDATLDYVSCYTQVACEDRRHVREICSDFIEAANEACPESEDYFALHDHSSQRVKRAHVLVRKYRIPR